MFLVRCSTTIVNAFSSTAMICLQNIFLHWLECMYYMSYSTQSTKNGPKHPILAHFRGFGWICFWYGAVQPLWMHFPQHLWYVYEICSYFGRCAWSDCATATTAITNIVLGWFWYTGYENCTLGWYGCVMRYFQWCPNLYLLYTYWRRHQSLCSIVFKDEKGWINTNNVH